MNGKILIIDDDRELCEEIYEILVDEGYKVDLAHDGQSGFNKLLKNTYGILLLDLKIPVMNGIEVLRKIKEKQLNIKTIILTGKPMGEDLHIITDKDKEDEKYIVKNSDAFINKPYNIDKLLTEIRRLLSSH